MIQVAVLELSALSKNDKYGVEDGNIAIYFALAYNQHQINRIVSSHIKKHLIINITSNYKTNVEQLQGRLGIRDK